MYDVKLETKTTRSWENFRNRKKILVFGGHLEVANRGRFEAEMEEQSTTCICRERVPNRVRYKRRVRRVAEVPSSRVATELPPRNVQVENTFRIGS